MGDLAGLPGQLTGLKNGLFKPGIWFSTNTSYGAGAVIPGKLPGFTTGRINRWGFDSWERFDVGFAFLGGAINVVSRRGGGLGSFVGHFNNGKGLEKKTFEAEFMWRRRWA